jgi:hypothetical protein
VIGIAPPSNYAQPTAIASDGTYVYYIDGVTNTVAEVPADGAGSPIVLTPPGFTGTPVGIGVAVAGLPVFSVNTGSGTTGVWKAVGGTAGSATQFNTITTGVPVARGYSVTNGDIGVVVAQPAQMVMPYLCGTAGNGCANYVALAAPLGGVTWPVGSNPYFATGSSIFAWSSQTGLLGFMSGLSTPTGLTTPTPPDNYLYWFTGQAPYTIQRHGYPVGDAGAVQTVSSLGDNMSVANLSTDGKYVYWSGTVGGVLGVYGAPVTGGTPILLAKVAATMDPVVVTTDATSKLKVVYYGDYNIAAMPRTGGIYKVAALP